MNVKPAYYNENDLYAAQWLRNLIDAGHIAPGVVDTRSIEDVTPADLAGFTQCHFFAGVGVWSLALRRAGWPDSRPVWTGSCPCQPFSASGEGLGFSDPRHLWPDFWWLIQQRRPAVVFGEQVASKIAGPWIDLVQSDLEAVGYSFGAVAFPSAGVGAPHIRDRIYWVGHANDAGPQRHAGYDGATGRSGPPRPAASTGVSSCVADTKRGQSSELTGEWHGPRAAVSTGATDRDSGRSALPVAPVPGPTNGFWRTADWLLCRDGKWRPVEPGTFPLVNGASSRVGRLRAYGNAINAQAAQTFIEAVMEIPS